MINEVLDAESFYKLLKGNKIGSCTIEITNTCSFFCDHCYIENKKGKFMTLETFKYIVDQLIELEAHSILITGGEPTMNPYFCDMYKYAKSKGLFVSINTNGFHFSENIKNTLLNFKPDLIEITLYGVDDNSYEKFTHVKDSYIGVMNTIDFLHKNNFKFNLKYTLTKQNYMYLQEARKLSNKYNNMFRYDYIIFPKIGNKGAGRNQLSLTPKEIVELLKLDEGDYKYFKNKVERVIKNKNSDHKKEKIFMCQIAKDRIYIDVEGNIRPCLVVNSEYNINNIKISDALDHIRKDIENIKFETNTKCKDCYKRSLCRYCPGRFYLENGSYEEKSDFYCELADEIIKNFK